MKKIFISALVGVIAFVSVASPLTVRADLTIDGSDIGNAPLPTYTDGVDVTYNGTVCAMANVLTWEMLQTFLYGVAGQQAYDVYANDEERQEALYSDFVEFCEDTSRGAQWSFQMNKNSAIVCYMTGKQALNYYKTAGSSALAEMQEKAKAGMRVINGRLNNNSLSPTPSPDNVEIVNLKEMELLGTGALTKCIGDYIVALVNGERGEVSETFLNPNGDPAYYFDGEYNIVDGDPHFWIYGDTHMHRWSGKEDMSFEGLQEWVYDYDNSAWGDLTRSDRFGLCLSTQITCDGKNYYCIDFGRKKGGLAYFLGDEFYLIKNNSLITNGNNDLCIEEADIRNVANIPIFNSREELEYFLETGNYYNAINYFKGEIKPADWLNYDFSQIASKLDDILQALTVLPIITTEDLAGFAQGIANGIIVGNVPASDPVAQQQQMQELLEENARKTATSSMANAVTDSETETEYTDDSPRPTATPEEITKKEEKRNATMVVDLREFFPFCIPFDLIRLIKVLNAEPQAPCFEGAIKYDKLGINVPVKLDLSMFDDGAKVFRTCELILFILSLLLVTRSLIRG